MSRKKKQRPDGWVFLAPGVVTPLRVWLWKAGVESKGLRVGIDERGLMVDGCQFKWGYELTLEEQQQFDSDRALIMQLVYAEQAIAGARVV